MSLREFLLLSKVIVVNKKVFIVKEIGFEPVFEIDCTTEFVLHIDDYLSDSVLNMKYRSMSIGLEIFIFVG